MMLTWTLKAGEAGAQIVPGPRTQLRFTGHDTPVELARDITKTIGLPGNVIEIRTSPAADSHCVPITHRFRIDATGGLVPLRAIVHGEDTAANFRAACGFPAMRDEAMEAMEEAKRASDRDQSREGS